MVDQDNSSDVDKSALRTYQAYLARVLTAISFACILGILGFNIDPNPSSEVTLVLFCVSMPITMIVAIISGDPLRNHHISILMKVIYFLGILVFSIAFLRLVATYSSGAAWALGITTFFMTVVASQAQDRFEKKQRKDKKRG